MVDFTEPEIKNCRDIKVLAKKGIDIGDVHLDAPLDKKPVYKTSFTIKPWDGSQGRFSDDGWAASTLIHGKTKSEQKLPIKELNGDVNINAVRNALARLSQTEGGDKGKIKAHLERLLEEYKSSVSKCVELSSGDLQEIQEVVEYILDERFYNRK